MKKLNQLGVVSLHTVLPIALVVLAIGGVGAYVLSKSNAASPSQTATGTVKVVSTSTSLSDPFKIDFYYSKNANQLKRPFIQITCLRDKNGDGQITYTRFSDNNDIVYTYQIYPLDSYIHPDYPVTITTKTNGLIGTVSAKLLSGSSVLANEKGNATCFATAEEWGTSLRNQTTPTLYATTPWVQLADNR